MKLILSSLFYLTFLILSPLRGEETESVVIVGSGVGGLSSALYLSRAGLNPLVIEGSTSGGLLTQSHSVQNWPGELEIEGAALTEKIRTQAEQNGARFLDAEVVSVDFSKRPFVLKTKALDGQKIEQMILAESCIIATGTTPHFLGIPGEAGPTGYWGRGVSNCAICDGSLYEGGKVGVVGGGDAAILEALYLSDLAKEVVVFVRKDKFKTIEDKRLETLLARPNIKVYYNTVLEAIEGDGEEVTGVKILEEKKASRRVPLNAVFLAIGSKPNTALFQGQIALDPRGYILLEKGQATSVPGVFAAGDVVDPEYKQAITAAGDGAKAALEAQQFLALHRKEVVKAKACLEEKLQTPIGVTEIQSIEELTKVLADDLPVVVDFYATWCGPCKRIGPRIDLVAEGLVGKVKFLKVNVDEARELSAKYQIRSMPTVLLLDSEGKVKERKVGTDQICELLNQLENTL